MDNLLQALINADRVCSEAHEYFDRANNLEIQNQNFMIKSLKKLKRWTIAFFTIYYLVMIGIDDKVGFSDPIPALIILFPLCFIPLYFWLKKRIRKLLEEQSEQQCGAIRLQGQNVLESNKNALSFLPTDYWYPLATSSMVKTVQAGRATTLPEAIDKFEEQLHRWKLEESNAQILAQQQAQSQ